jgi:hypothetical protein
LFSGFNVDVPAAQARWTITTGVVPFIGEHGIDWPNARWPKGRQVNAKKKAHSVVGLVFCSGRRFWNRRFFGFFLFLALFVSISHGRSPC